ncbi:hypothetical protein AB0F96_05815 [Streptomyces sp. NPDC023998]|uniref:hypothetical protein n=1 Tax=Streptomyces sp. NPDC023998 TaxID=3154597 RepID=UPI0033FA106F
MTITYAQLDHLNLSRVDHALTAWKEVVRKMKEVDDSHGPKAQKPFEAAGCTDPPTGLRCAVGAVVCCHTCYGPLPGL